MRLPKGRLFWAVSLGHAVNDLFMSLRSVIFTFISAYILPMSNQNIGLAISLIELSGALSQPFFGWKADKTGGRWLGALGVAWTASFFLIALLVVMLGGSFWLMLIPLTLAGLGSGAFHPVGSMHATDSDPLRSNRNAAFFFMCGQIGLGIGPALVGLLLNNAHTRMRETYGIFLGPAYSHLLIERGSIFPVFMLFLLVIPTVLWMAVTIPNRKAHHATQHESKPASPTAVVPVAKVKRSTFILLALAVTTRSLANPSMANFMPQIFNLKGWSPAEYGLLASLFWIASGVAGLWFGYLGDRFDNRRMITLSLLLSVPGIFLLPDLNGVLAFGSAIIVGAMSGTHSLIVVLAQSLLPGRKGFASGAILGFIFATGALGNLVVGTMIDHLGMDQTFQIVAIVTLLGSFVWLVLPDTRRRSLVVEAPDTLAVPGVAS